MYRRIYHVVAMTITSLLALAGSAQATISIRGGDPSMPPWPESSPVFVGSSAYVSTSYSYSCRLAGSVLECPSSPAYVPEPDVLWLRDYNGVFGGARIGAHELLVVHGENNNQVVGGVYSHTTVTKDTTCWGGYLDGSSTWTDCWADYFGFASARLDGRDLGPIAWPRDGYLKKGDTAATNGIRHPTSIVYGGYVWVFYCDTSFPGGSIAVERSPVGALGAPASWRTWTGSRWAPSLPAGFTAAQASSYLHSSGPPAAAVAPGSWFAVTQVGKLFYGFSYGWIAPGVFGTRVYISPDLLHWLPSRRMWTSKDFGSGTVRYPRPLSSTAAISTTGSRVEVLKW